MNCNSDRQGEQTRLLYRTLPPGSHSQ